MIREKRKPLRVKIVALILLVLLLYALRFTVSPIHAAETTDIGYSLIHPASPYYFLKTIRENIELKFAVTTRVKYLRQLEFATRRLRETKTLISQNQDLIPPTLEKYIMHLNTITDKHIPNDEFVPILKNSLNIHLEVLRQTYDLAVNARARMSIRSALNRVIKRADVSDNAKLLVCNFFAKEASSGALNQTEQVVLSDRAKNCLNSLRDTF